jgi:hypothetical protein
MSYETTHYENRYNCNNQVEVEEEEYENNNENNTNTTSNIEMSSVDSWRLRTLYTDTKYVCAAKPRDEVLSCDKLFAYQNAPQTHPSCLPVIVKDITQPYTYYTVKSYGNAQDNNYYVNFDDHVSGLATATTPSHYHNSNNIYNNNNNAFDPEANPSFTFENSGCVKTYLCSLLGCFVCCLFHLKPY